jgi:glycosyltransferase involved in cell wall biosynthesis
MSERVIYIVRSWPRLSQTFIVNEVLALERRGLELAVFSLVRSGERLVQPQVAEVRASVHYLEDRLRRPWSSRIRLQLAGLLAAPLRYALVLWFCLRHPGLAAGYGDCSTLRCFFHAVRIASSVEDMRAAGAEPVHVHAHFAHDPALVGMLVARLTGLPFSFTAHARDLVQIPAKSLAVRAADATALVTCCAANADYIDSAVPAADRPPVLVIHHGVELGRFVPTPRDPAVEVPNLLSVGRLVEKKGYVDLLHALGTVKARGVDFRCRIYGDGPLQQELTELRDSLGLHGQVELMGARSNEQILAALRVADAFVLAPKVVEGGDRDGIPNVLVEAMACGLPVAATSAGGITELVQHDVNGLVSEPGDVDAMAESITGLLTDPGRRARLGEAARHTVERGYDIDVAAHRLEGVLRAQDTSVLEVSR